MQTKSKKKVVLSDDDGESENSNVVEDLDTNEATTSKQASRNKKSTQKDKAVQDKSVQLKNSKTYKKQTKVFTFA